MRFAGIPFFGSIPLLESRQCDKKQPLPRARAPSPSVLLRIGEWHRKFDHRKAFALSTEIK